MNLQIPKERKQGDGLLQYLKSQTSPYTTSVAKL